MTTSPEIDKLVVAMATAYSQFKPVVRSATGQVGQNRSYKYADLAALIEATFPALSGNNLAVFQAVSAETQTLVTRICHSSGQWVESTYPLHAYDRPQDFGSQLSYARRYSLLALLCVAQEDDDGASAQAAEKKPSRNAAVIEHIKNTLPDAEPPARPAEGWTPVGEIAKTVAPTLKPPPEAATLISEAQRKRFFAIAKQHNWPMDVLKEWLKSTGFDSSYAITKDIYQDLCSALEQGPPDLSDGPVKAPEDTLAF